MKHSALFFRQSIILLLLLCPLFVQTKGISRQYIFVGHDFGLCSTDIAGTTPDEHMPAGHMTYSSNFRLLKKTIRIKAALDAHFGMTFKIFSKTLKTLPVTKVWTFPRPMKDPVTGRIFKELRYTDDLTTNNEHYASYRLEKPYELIKGHWQLSFYCKDALLHRVSFELY